MKMILDLFAGGHSVTCLKDAHMTTFSASATTDVQENATVTLTVTPASGYEVDEIEVCAGGVTVTLTSSTYSFTMGTADVTLYCKSKKNDLYMVTEECMASVNDSKVVLHANNVIALTPNGVPKAVTAANGGAEITLTPAIQNLIDQGILVKI